MMQELGVFDVEGVAGGDGVLGTIDAIITIGEAIYAVGSYFAQDNGGPSAADWCASVGYVG